MARLLLALFLCVGLTGCGGLSGLISTDTFTVTTQWPAKASDSTNALALAESVRIEVLSAHSESSLGSHVQNRPGSGSGNVDSKWSFLDNRDVRVRVTAYAARDAAGEILGQRILESAIPGSISYNTIPRG